MTNSLDSDNSFETGEPRPETPSSVPLDSGRLDEPPPEASPVERPAEALSEDSIWLPESHPVDVELDPYAVLTSMPGVEVMRRPGPGILTGFLWMMSVLLIHVVGIVITIIALFATNVDVIQQVARNPDAARRILDPFMAEHTFFLMAGEMFVFVLAALVVTRLKHGPNTARVLGLRGIPLPSLILIVASVLPLSLFCSGLHQKMLPVWEDLAAGIPVLDQLSGLDVNQQLLPLGESAPAWALLLVIAVAPAVGEELMFRGIIGHGLVGRYGVFAGVLITSLFFAVVHLHPVSIVALMPLAVFIHLSWLATRSFYAPVLVHFLNNALAVFVIANSEQLGEAAEAAGEVDASWPAIGLAALALAPAVVALWRNRVEFRLSDGSTWNPGYVTAATPPAEVNADAVFEIRSPWLYGIGLLLCGGLSLVFLVSTLNAVLGG